MKWTFIAILCIALCTSCGKEEFPNNGEGVIRGMGGSCGWLIEFVTPEGEIKFLEPLNIEEFGIDLHDGLQVEYKYQVAEEQYSSCMMGSIVNLKKLNKK